MEVREGERERESVRGQRRVCFFSITAASAERRGGTINFTETRKKRHKQIRKREGGKGSAGVTQVKRHHCDGKRKVTQFVIQQRAGEHVH